MWTEADTAAEMSYKDHQRLDELIEHYDDLDNEDLKLAVRYLEFYMKDSDNYYQEVERLRPYEYESECLKRYTKELEVFKIITLLKDKPRSDVKKIIDRNRTFYRVDGVLTGINAKLLEERN